MSYSPNFKTTDFKQTTWWERKKDKLYGTNYQGKADAYNREQAQITANQNAYELQKAVNMNKYSWNQQGMIQAGINPLAASGSLGSVSAPAQGQSSGGMSQGGIGEVSTALIHEVKDMLHELSPSTFIKDVKSIMKHKV